MTPPEVKAAAAEAAEVAAGPLRHVSLERDLSDRLEEVSVALVYVVTGPAPLRRVFIKFKIFGKPDDVCCASGETGAGPPGRSTVWSA